MKCTAPCIPTCTNEATGTLLNAKSGAVLGHNCEACLAPLLRPPEKREVDYTRGPLPDPTLAELRAKFGDWDVPEISGKV